MLYSGERVGPGIEQSVLVGVGLPEQGVVRQPVDVGTRVELLVGFDRGAEPVRTWVTQRRTVAQDLVDAWPGEKLCEDVVEGVRDDARSREWSYVSRGASSR
ncbi:hypothetical protein GCM10028775_46540 [Catellatospora paridis]